MDKSEKNNLSYSERNIGELLYEHRLIKQINKMLENALRAYENSFFN